jgi:hypothetical protein
MKCLIDGSEHNTLEDLHKHLKTLKVRQDTYYTEIAPQRDLCTGEPIPFKTPVEKYLQKQFAHKNNLKRWLKEKPEEGKAWAIEWLKKRKTEKGLTYPPSQTELRSLMCPTIPYYNHIGGYNQICAELGYTVRYHGALPDAINPPGTLIIDTREQNPLKFAVPTMSQKLVCGDYGLEIKHDNGVYIERKSLPDMVGTLSDRETKPGDSNLARFRREIERAAEMEAYIVMLVESDINQAMGFSHLPHMKHVWVSEEHIFKNLRDLLRDYPNFQAVFVKGRVEASRTTLRILACGESIKNVDLQLEYEEDRL